jgi:hypothetical protein
MLTKREDKQSQGTNATKLRPRNDETMAPKKSELYSSLYSGYRGVTCPAEAQRRSSMRWNLTG